MQEKLEKVVSLLNKMYTNSMSVFVTFVTYPSVLTLWLLIPIGTSPKIPNLIR